MTLVYILIFIPVALIAGKLIPRQFRMLFILGASLITAYALQPVLPVRNLDFWLPTLSIGLVVLTWITVRSVHPDSKATSNAGEEQKAASAWRVEIPTLIVFAVIILAIALSRYTGNLCCLTATRPPPLWQVLTASGIFILIAWMFSRGVLNKRILASGMIGFILVLFVILKSPALSERASIWLRSLTGQNIELAAATDLVWLGFSFLAFRLMHTLRDFQSGKLPGYRLGEFSSYALFFPAYTAGPIDRAQRWIQELQSQNTVSSSDIIDGSWRILIGIFKKFVLADSLALVALNAQNASQVHSTFWAWFILYAYALRIYLDFSGYTDIAIGLGRYAGFKLPENFASPYLKTNLTAFWNSWHITLAQWFRAYFFNPLTRYLRAPGGKKVNIPVWAIILTGQITTMLLIGLWHGITENFAIWGLWHGVGLFLHNRWSEWVRPRSADLEKSPSFARLAQVGGWLLTFNFVAVGWVWFSLPTPALAGEFIKRLVGL